MFQKIPSIIAGRIQSHPEAQGHHPFLRPDHKQVRIIFLDKYE